MRVCAPGRGRGRKDDEGGEEGKEMKGERREMRRKGKERR